MHNGFMAGSNEGRRNSDQFKGGAMLLKRIKIKEVTVCFFKTFVDVMEPFGQEYRVLWICIKPAAGVGKADAAFNGNNKTRVVTTGKFCTLPLVVVNKQGTFEMSDNKVGYRKIGHMKFGHEGSLSPFVQQSVSSLVVLIII